MREKSANGCSTDCRRVSSSACKQRWMLPSPSRMAESELIAQAYLWGNLEATPTDELPATPLRDSADIQATRSVLMEMVRKKFLLNIADNLEDVERRLQKWLTYARMLENMAYKVGMNWDSLWLKLLHAGSPLEQQRRLDRGENWPLWAELIAESRR